MSKSYWVYGTSRCQNLIGSMEHQDVKSRVFMGHQNVKKLSVFVGPPDIKILAMGKMFVGHQDVKICQNLIGSMGHQDVKILLGLWDIKMSKVGCSWDIKMSKNLVCSWDLQISKS
ncbi:hypothetical protein CDAR_249031 [Caerostris darwini]|uniref:Uncharacterized protein n=1 Tax=Caerostris darwini TaxID=1538125 RepID=A0AAV4S817_9ARAC|nr:hypothetical protein CDAR_249031 [Caerostris darwini]